MLNKCGYILQSIEHGIGYRNRQSAIGRVDFNSFFFFKAPFLEYFVSLEYFVCAHPRFLHSIETSNVKSIHTYMYCT